MGALHGDRARRLGGWFLVVIGLLLLVSVPLSLSGGVLSRPGVVAAGPGSWIAVFVPAFVLSGGLLVHLRPQNPIGWILLVSGLFQVTNLAADAYATRALTDPDDSLPLGLTMAWLASWTWPPSLLLPMLVLPALYPTGRPSSSYWRWHVRASLVGIVLAALAMASGPGGLDDTVAGTRLPWTAPVWTSHVLGLSAAVLLIAAAASSIVGTFVRAWRASAPERQQLLWLISVVAVLVATTFNPPEILFVLSYTLIPVAVAIGVLRYGLLGIELALRRTLLYAPLTVMVALVVGGLTTALARLAPEGPLPLLAASAVVAVVLVPVAAWMRRAVDRLVLGERADPLAVVGRVGAGLKVEHDDPVASMLEAVASAADASYAVVRDEDGQLLAQVGATGVPVLRVPLRHGGQDLGMLEVGAATGQRSPAGRDLRLVTALAPQLAVVVRSSRLTQDLARARVRVTRATLVERDRLRRDLHDGLGPSLSGIALGLEAAATAYDTDPGAIPELLRRTRIEADAAVREIRRVLDGLRPGALDLHGLDGAVRDTASSLGMGRPGAPHFDTLECRPLRGQPAAGQRRPAGPGDRRRVGLRPGPDPRPRIGLDAAPCSRRRREPHHQPSGPLRHCRHRRPTTGGARMTLRIVIADDHPMYRFGLTAVLSQGEGVEVVASVGDGSALIAAVAEHAPDLVLTDLAMPDLDGVAATRQLLEARPELPIIALTTHEDDEHVFAALRAGARGYLVKGADGEEILRAVHAVAGGGAVYGGSVARRIVAFYAGNETQTATERAFPDLTPRERDVLELLALGCRNHEISRRLSMSEKTVRNHVSQVLTKLQVPDRTAAALKARGSGIG